MILKNYKIVEFATEIKKYLQSVKGLSADTLLALSEASLNFDDAAEAILRKESALKKAMVDILGEHNINPDGSVRKELINSLNDYSRNLFNEYGTKINDILEEEQNIDIAPIDKTSILPCDDALAYRAAVHVAILSKRDIIENG